MMIRINNYFKINKNFQKKQIKYNTMSVNLISRKVPKIVMQTLVLKIRKFFYKMKLIFYSLENKVKKVLILKWMMRNKKILFNQL